jgi:hypothetical protein
MKNCGLDAKYVMDNTLQKMIDMWAEQQAVVDPKLATTIGKNIQAQVGAKAGDTAKIDPKAVINKAVTGAAVKDPAGVTQLLNKKQMKKKMKKEHNLLTLEEFRDKKTDTCKKCGKMMPCKCKKI